MGMKTFDFIEATISHQLKDPHSKALEPDCLSPSPSNYDTAFRGEREGVRGLLFLCFDPEVGRVLLEEMHLV
jgi:hypothetical protein